MKNTHHRFLMLLVLCLLPINEAAGQEVEADWAAIRIAFQEFVEYPSSKNASHVISVLPNKHVKYTDSPEEQKAINYIFDADNFGMLERQVISRNREAVRLAFKLHSIADGAFAEELNIMLGAMIRVDPKLFLEELMSAKPTDKFLDNLLGNYGPEYVDRSKAQCLETKLRISAIEIVKVPSLIKIRDRCIGKLKMFTKKLCR